MRAMLLAKHRVRVKDIKAELCGTQRLWLDSMNGFIELSKATASVKATFKGRTLHDDELLKILGTSREDPIYIRSFQNSPIKIQKHDTQITALPCELLVGHIMPLLSNQDKVSLACTNARLGAMYRSSLTRNMSGSPRLHGDEILIKALRTDQTLRIVTHLMSVRSELTSEGKNIALLIALCRKRDPEIVRALLDQCTGEEVLSVGYKFFDQKYYVFRAFEEICKHLPQRGNVKLRELVKELAEGRCAEHAQAISERVVSAG